MTNKRALLVEVWCTLISLNFYLFQNNFASLRGPKWVFFRLQRFLLGTLGGCITFTCYTGDGVLVRITCIFTSSFRLCKEPASFINLYLWLSMKILKIKEHSSAWVPFTNKIVVETRTAVYQITPQTLGICKRLSKAALQFTVVHAFAAFNQLCKQTRTGFKGGWHLLMRNSTLRAFRCRSIFYFKACDHCSVIKNTQQHRVLFFRSCRSSCA